MMVRLRSPRVVLVFGNPDLESDSLPLRITPPLRKLFPKFQFELIDPNEEFPFPREILMIDTIVGIADVKLFEDINEFLDAPRVSVHDFDALASLKLQQKLGKVQKIRVIGVPAKMGEEEAVKKVAAILRSSSL